MASHLSKFADFQLPHVHLAPRLEMTLFEFHRDVWCQKTSMSGLLHGLVSVILGLAI